MNSVDLTFGGGKLLIECVTLGGGSVDVSLFGRRGLVSGAIFGGLIHSG